LLTLLATGSSFAGPIEDRKEVMKGFQAATKDGMALARSAVPFDLDRARALLEVYTEGAEKLPKLFPKGTESGSDTLADPKIWSDTSGFALAAKKIGDDATKAQSAHDAVSFASAFSEVTKDCASCHGVYRLKRQ
jgi:cytochrome c556